MAAQQLAANDINALRGMSLADVLEVDISTGTAKFLRQAPAIAYVITADDIERLGARNVLEALEAVPGVSVMYQASITNSPLVAMRGSFTSRGGHVLFLRDGKPLRTMGNNTMPEIFRLPVQMVERIEIARGPGSSVYGADALVGTVNIITKKKPREVGVAVGTDGGYDSEWGGVSSQWGVLEWSLGATHSKNEDAAVTRIFNPQPRQFSQNWKHDYTDLDVKLRAGRFYADVWALNYDKNETGDVRNPAPRTLVRTGHRHFDAGFDADLTSTTKLNAVAIYTRFRGLREGEIVPPGAPAQPPENAEVRTTGDFTVTETRWKNHRVRANIGMYRERRVEIIPPARPPGTPAPANPYRYDRYFGLQDEWGFAPDWELTAGVRWDRYSDYGTIPNPRAGLVWTVNPQLTTKLLLGEAFRAPVFQDPTVAGRTPERMKNVELAFDYRPRDEWSVVLSIFEYRARDLAEVTGPATTVLLARDGKGGELAVGWQPHAKWRFDAGVSYVDVVDHTTKARVPYTTKNTLKAAASWRPVPEMNVNLRWEAYFDRATPATPANRPALDDYNVGHFTARYDFTPRLSGSVVVHNITDNRAWIPFIAGQPQDVQLFERSSFVQVEYRFQ